MFITLMHMLIVVCELNDYFVLEFVCVLITYVLCAYNARIMNVPHAFHVCIICVFGACHVRTICILCLYHVFWLVHDGCIMCEQYAFRLRLICT